jgi:hypothetical protein
MRKREAGRSEVVVYGKMGLMKYVKVYVVVVGEEEE